jgi:hypothetical protein
METPPRLRHRTGDAMADLHADRSHLSADHQPADELVLLLVGR